MIYVSRSAGSGRIRPPRVLRTPTSPTAVARRLAVALALVAPIALVMGAVLILGGLRPTG